MLLNNLNNIIIENYVRGDEAFQCRRCDKLYVSKEFLESHIQTMHPNLKYNSKDIVSSVELLEKNTGLKSF